MPFSPVKNYENMISTFVEKICYVKPMQIFFTNNKRSLSEKIKSYLYAAYKSRLWHLYPVFRIYFFIKVNKINLVHTNTLMSIDAAFASRLAGVSHTQHIREITGKMEGSLGSLLFQESSFFKSLYKFLNKRIICNSAYSYQSSLNSFPNEIMEIVYNPICFEVKKHTEREQEDFKPFIVGIVANVTARMKNHSLVIEIAKRIKNKYGIKGPVFYFYGNLPSESDSYLQELRKEIEKNKMEQIISFKGLCKPSVIYSQIHLLLHPYPYESFGRVYMEALFNGKPVIAFNGGGASEFIDNGKNGFLFGFEELDKIADCIHKFITNTAHYNQCSKFALESAQDFKLKPGLQQFEKIVLDSN